MDVTYAYSDHSWVESNLISVSDKLPVRSSALVLVAFLALGGYLRKIDI